MEDETFTDDLNFVLSLNTEQITLLAELVTVAVAGCAAHDSTNRILQRFGQVAKRPRQSEDVRRNVGNVRRRLVHQPQEIICATA